MPIEEIVEFQLRWNIIPIPNLYRTFRIEGWLSGDLRTVCVDEKQLSDFETRYRFTLAHEVAHSLIHASFYRFYKISSTEEWIKTRVKLDRDLIDRLEWQARNLAGRILVPTDRIVAHGNREIRRLGKRAARPDRAILEGQIATRLATVFNVSDYVVMFRLTGDKVSASLSWPSP